MNHPFEASQEAAPTLPELLELSHAELVKRLHEATLCSCEVEEDGGPESGPHLSIVEVDVRCPMHGAHTPEYQEGLEQERGYELSLLCSAIEQAAKGYEQAAAAMSSELEPHHLKALELRAEGLREALEYVRSTDAGRGLAQAEAEGREAWEQNTREMNR